MVGVSIQEYKYKSTIVDVEETPLKALKAMKKDPCATGKR